jgi:hypothetical protein
MRVPATAKSVGAQGILQASGKLQKFHVSFIRQSGTAQSNPMAEWGRSVGSVVLSAESGQSRRVISY